MSDKFEHDVHAVMQSQVATLDPDTCAKLSQARQVALNPVKKKASTWLSLFTLVPVMAVAMLVVTIMPSYDESAVIVSPPEWVTTASQEELALYQDLAFYEWLTLVEMTPATDLS